ncbi:protein kinase [Methanocalculus taiwanensis]|uniref:Protein kinase n=1 Tax=Methanocalculus taiwanensis TaxID=106207 RepID=A0ABD4TND2_9EURY|nr:protein kinase [Methanocalculus taiwanensis]MCQ1539513.1 protein kinase [Methanocalculus taiwanensis]
MGLFDFLKGSKKSEDVTANKELERKTNEWGSYGTGDGQLNGPTHIAVAPDGTVYVTEYYNRRIQVFTGDGTFLRKWGSFGTGDGQFQMPQGTAVAPDGTVYVADAYCIQLFTGYGRFLRKWGSWGSGDGHFIELKGVAIAPDGTVYVADTRNSRIQVFTRDGTFLRKWGSKGTGEGQFTSPSGIAVAPDGSIYVTESGNQRVQVFTPEGSFIRTWGRGGSGDGQLRLPQGIAVAPDGTVYVADTKNNRIQVFTGDGTFLRKWGSKGTGEGQFTSPSGIAVAPDGTVYVADTKNNRISFFDEKSKKEDIRNKILSLDKKGITFTNEGRIEESLECYKQALELDPANSQIKEKHDAHKMLILNKNGLTFTSEGRFAEALECYNLSLELDPANSQIKKKRDALIARTPEISIAFSKTSLAPNKWEQIDFTLKNFGKATAEKLTVGFSDIADVRRTETTYTVQAGESVTDTVSIKSDAHGRAPLDVTMKYRDFANRTFETTSTIWLTISDTGATSAPGFSASSPPPTSSTDPSALFARYQSHDLIGEGGFARVYRVIRDGKVYAVKVPKTPDSATGKTFISEIQNWTRLNHPNIVKVFDYNILPTPYFEMEYCEASLDSLPKPMSPDQAAWLIYGVCTGLHYAHSLKIIHRDLKPQNILIKEGIPKITDWGLSKVMTESKSTTSTSFTPYYAAPEQMGSQPKDERTDIWQLGAILYELVTGTVPFTGDSMMEVMMGIMSRDPVKPTDLNPDAKELEPVILRCLEKDPAKRFGSVTELQRVLAFYLKVTYTEALKKSQGSDDRRSAYLCGELLLIHLDSGELPKALLYGKDLIRYTSGEGRATLESLVEQMSFCIDEGLDDLPEELMRKAEWIVHGSRLEGMG